MTYMKHAPGPWAYSPTKTEDVTHVVRDADGVGIAVVNSMMPQSNAHLIAAAPDLLQALIAARDELREVTAELYGEDHNSPQINAAIAKAKGLPNDI